MATQQHRYPTLGGGTTRDREALCALVAATPALTPFRDLPPAVHAQLAMLSRVRPFPDGSALRAGVAGERAYLLLRGRIRLERAGAAPVEVGPGTLLTGLPEATTGAQPPTTHAVGAVEALVISHVALGLTMMQFPEAEEVLRAALGI